METVSVESASRGDIQSVSHKTAPPRKPLSPDICPGYQHGEVRHLEREIRAGLTASDVVDVEVLARRQLVLVPSA